MIELQGQEVILQDGELLRRQGKNREYMMSLSDQHLLRNFELEAGRFTNREIDTEALGGWESPTCQLRGHFLGHWLSAAADLVRATGDVEVKAKADAIVSELGRCQDDNGDGWAGSIPEKYLDFIAMGRPIWAPQYTLHKTMMGLTDMYELTGNREALRIADRWADWFLEWSGKFTREEFDNILDVETGGMLEIWAQLLVATGDAGWDKYTKLLNRYYRRRLFEPLLEGRDPLTNMHANTTIPEVLGCAKAYEVTGEEKWLKIVEAYWKCAVDQRGTFATGGQTQGEVWTPKQKLLKRLGDKNQEHCTVYNMCRLADFLFCQTRDPKYLDYMEYNFQNGILAQSYWEEVEASSQQRREGLLTYFLPMKAGGRKLWAGRRDAFFCCHGTMVQANARLNHGIFYMEEDTDRDDGDGLPRIYIGQYRDAQMTTKWKQSGKQLTIRIQEDHLNGLSQICSENNQAQEVNDIAARYENRPDYRKEMIRIQISDNTGERQEEEMILELRIPDWVTGDAVVFLNGDIVSTCSGGRFASIHEVFRDGDVLELILPIGIKFIPLPDAPDVGAFRYGPDVLVGLEDKERILHLEQGQAPEEELEVECERQWGTWLTCFKSVHQDPGITFHRINEVGDEPYQMYFRIKS